MIKYNVVFEHTGEEGTVEGIRNWTTYKSEEDFKKSYVSNNSERVIADGVTVEEAVRLCGQVLLEVRLRESVNASTDENGEVNRDVLRMNVTNSFFAVILGTDYREPDNDIKE